VTNVDFDKWGNYLADGPAGVGYPGQVVEGAIILKVKGKSYRAQQTDGAENKVA
jgi:hypothetical protein